MPGDGVGGLAMPRAGQWSVEWPQSNAPAGAGGSTPHALPRGHPGAGVPVRTASGGYTEADPYAGFGSVMAGDAALGQMYAHPVHPHMAVMGDDTFHYAGRSMSMGAMHMSGSQAYEHPPQGLFGAAPHMQPQPHGQPLPLQRSHSAAELAQVHDAQMAHGHDGGATQHQQQQQQQLQQQQLQQQAQAQGQGQRDGQQQDGSEQLASLFANSLSLTEPQAINGEHAPAPSMLPTQGSPEDDPDENNRLSIFAKFSF
eukprot:TRINITY_DN24_c2_g1_i1.p2 TRINITY_DN24_c2_g1~~TRINITY_DN24_c2_g1_i1.p2  ORF type:complete len:256 (+),score=72.70 TRINITY_DN24_c2_g1_i1:613-1380(+)